MEKHEGPEKEKQEVLEIEEIFVKVKNEEIQEKEEVIEKEVKDDEFMEKQEVIEKLNLGFLRMEDDQHKLDMGHEQKILKHKHKSPRSPKHHKSPRSPRLSATPKTPKSPRPKEGPEEDLKLDDHNVEIVTEIEDEIEYSEEELHKAKEVKKQRKKMLEKLNEDLTQLKKEKMKFYKNYPCNLKGRREPSNLRKKHKHVMWNYGKLQNKIKISN